MDLLELDGLPLVEVRDCLLKLVAGGDFLGQGVEDRLDLGVAGLELAGSGGLCMLMRVNMLLKTPRT